MQLDIETVAKTFALWKRSGWFVPPEIDGQAAAYWFVLLQSEGITREELEAVTPMASKRLKKWPILEDILAFVKEVREASRLRALANHVEAIDATGRRVLAHRSQVNDGHIVPVGAPANGLPINQVPVLEAHATKDDVLNGMTEGGKRMLASIFQSKEGGQ